MKGFMNLISKEQKEEVRQHMGIEILRINNYSLKEVIEYLNTKLTLGNRTILFRKSQRSGGLAICHKCMRDLVEFGYIQYQPSYNPTISSLLLFVLLTFYS
jgi:hypothetical protein